MQNLKMKMKLKLKMEGDKANPQDEPSNLPCTKTPKPKESYTGFGLVGSELLDSIPSFSNAKKKKEGDGKFRFAANKIFLTYSQCPLDKDVILTNLKLIETKIRKYRIGQEHHKDGSLHIHVFLQTEEKMNFVNERHFDIVIDGITYHPCMKPVTNTDGCIDYCGKDGNYIEDNIDQFTTSIGFTRKKTDQDNFRAYRQSLNKLKVCYPINFNCEPFNIDYIWNEISTCKQDHVWIISDPDLGKTSWINDTFAGQNVYLRPNNDVPFERYNDEDLIIYDDIIPPLAEIIDVSNIWKLERQVYGKVRYKTKLWKMGHRRRMLFLTNRLPTYHDTGAFMSRIRVFDLRKKNAKEELEPIIYLGDDVNDYN